MGSLVRVSLRAPHHRTSDTTTERWDPHTCTSSPSLLPPPWPPPGIRGRTVDNSLHPTQHVWPLLPPQSLMLPQMASLIQNLETLPGWDSNKCPAAKSFLAGGAAGMMVSVPLIALVVARLLA